MKQLARPKLIGLVIIAGITGVLLSVVLGQRAGFRSSSIVVGVIVSFVIVVVALIIIWKKSAK